MKTRSTFFTLAALMLWTVPWTLQARPGDLDPTYSHAGVATQTFNSYSTLGNAALQTDGKLVVVGQAANPAANNTYQPFIARFTTDGKLDPSFGNNGFVITRFPIANQPSNIYETGSYNAIAIQSDGKIIAAGTSQSNWCCSGYYNDPILARYNPNGLLDTTFGAGGRVFTNTGTQAAGFYANAGMRIYHLTIAPDGSFYAVGGDGDRTPAGSSTSDRPTVVLKYSSKGTLLASAFPNYAPSDKAKHSTWSVLQSDGKLVINITGGGYGGAAVIVDFVLMRFNSDLSVDSSFGSDGVVVTDFGTGTEQANGILLDPDGTITVAGSSASSTDTGDCFVARYTPKGALDSSFGSDGKVIIAPSKSPFVFLEGQAIARQSDGKYVIALGGRYGELGAIRLRSNGAIDVTFGYGGIANYQTNEPNSPYPTINGNGGLLFLQADGKILLPATDANHVDAVNGVKVLRLLNGGQFLNIATRMNVLTGNKVLIGGFIITGSDPKKVAIRAIGPSLPVSGSLADPMLELHDSNGNVIATNDNWKTNDQTGQSQEAAVRATTIAPSKDSESFILATLPANNASYTAIVQGKNGDTGIGVVEVYDLAQDVNSQLANISTRGFVDIGDKAMIGGLISGNGIGTDRVVIRAIGPSIPLDGALQNPVLEVHNAHGDIIGSNNNWQSDSNASQVQSVGLAPKDPRESALYMMLAPGSYTAIVRGVNNTTGIGLVEVYNLQ
jgi:uncharacterized delta-60 repeat protein